eukprot:2525160-Amphidinium_carterae.1
MAARKLRDPVFRLFRPLYGWNCSGNLWEGYLEQKMHSNGWQNVPEWSQTYYKVVNGNVLVCTVYVDDFLMAGKGHRDEWQKLSEDISL